MNKIIVFDTNAYRKFVEGKDLSDIQKGIDAMVAQEKERGYVAFMSTTVGEELLSHMKDGEDNRHFKSCLKAVQAIYRHTGDANSFRLVPLPETQITKELFGVDNNKSINVQKVVGNVLFNIANDPTLETINKYDSEIQQIIDYINGAENTLSYEIELMMKSIDPAYSDWTLFKDDESNRTKWLNFVRSDNFKLQTAFAFLVAVRYDLESQGIQIKEFSKDEIKKQADYYMKSYAPPLELRKYWMEQLVGHFDLTKKSRANFLWDERILHQAGHAIGGVPIMLVTTDGKMKECAQKVMPSCEIVTFADYLQLLNY